MTAKNISGISRQVKLRAISASVLLVATLLIGLQGASWLSSISSPELTVRQVELTVLPPPPPPPPKIEQAVDAPPLAITVAGAGAALPITLDLSTPQLDTVLEAPALTQMEPQWQNVEVDWQAVSLESLDALPSLLTPVRVVFPKSLQRQGVKRVLVKLDIVIDEQGYVTLVDVAENPYPELKPQLDVLVKNSRFSAPTQHNQPVKARFIWPIELTQ